MPEEYRSDVTEMSCDCLTNTAVCWQAADPREQSLRKVFLPVICGAIMRSVATCVNYGQCKCYNNALQ